MAHCSLLPPLLLLVLCSLSETCKTVIRVPYRLEAGVLIGKVNFTDCLASTHLIVRSNDPDIIAENDGSLYARRDISMSSEKRTSTLSMHDLNSKVEKKMTLKLVHKKKLRKTRVAREAILRRSKRRWAPQPFSVKENALPPFPQKVQQVQSDTQQNYTLRYSINGAGVDEEPKGLFSIDPESGMIFISRAVDREECASYHFMANAKTIEGYSTEIPLDVIVKINDDNDNSPQFTEESFCAVLYEHSKAGTVVGKVNATDRDEPGSLHTQLKYSIISQFPSSPPLFAIDGISGIVTVTSPNTDRETTDEYVLILQVQDMDGRSYGLTSTGTMTITIGDINDHAPTFTQASYQGEVYENEKDKTVLCFPVKDEDLVNSSNWRANFSIIQGNEDGKFQIVTNPVTNEGCLRVVKPLNFEEKSRYQLQVAVANDSPLVTKSGTISTVKNTVPITVLVKDVDEGPEFTPVVWYVRVKEEQPAGTFIYKCSAKDPETKLTDGISYTKLTDPFSWVNISPTCEITTAKVLDRESPNMGSGMIRGSPEMQNGQYNVTILATDQSGKTGTGTLVITLDDINDNDPNITKMDSHMCIQNKRSMNIEAQDLDVIPNSAPLKFSLDDSTDSTLKSQWRIIQHDGTSMTLEDIGSHPVGRYAVPISIVDQQGKGSTHRVAVVICNCIDGSDCPSIQGRSAAVDVSLGPWAILVMILSILLLALLLCLLLACLCGAAGTAHLNKSFLDDGAQQNLIVSNTEAPGEELMSPNFKVPVHITNSNVTGKAPPGSFGQSERVLRERGHSERILSERGHSERGQSERGHSEREESFVTGQVKNEVFGVGQHPPYSGMQGSYLLDQGKYSYSEWQNFMQVHLEEKLYHCSQDEEHKRADDYVLAYNYEGKGSLAGSVGCCSDIQGEDEMVEFSKNLEPKFRTLADICTKK